jgi:hypothetical protein
MHGAKTMHGAARRMAPAAARTPHNGVRRQIPDPDSGPAARPWIVRFRDRAGGSGWLDVFFIIIRSKVILIYIYFYTILY